MVGLSQQDILDSRQGTSPGSRVEAALQFARTVVHQRGRVGDDDVARLRRVRYSDGEIAEIVANVAVNLFSNYFNHVARTDVDFPSVPALSASANTLPGVVRYAAQIQALGPAVRSLLREHGDDPKAVA